MAPIVFYYLFFLNRVYFGITFLGVDIGGMTTAEAKNAISQKSNELSNQRINIRADQVLEMSLADTGYSVDVDKTTDKAIETFRSSNWVSNFIGIISVIKNKYELAPQHNWNSKRFDENVLKINQISGFTRAAPAAYKMNGGRLEVVPSESGYRIDDENLKRDIENSLTRGKNEIIIKTVRSEPEFSTEIANNALPKAEEISKIDVLVKYDYATYKISGGKLVEWLEIYPNEGNKIIIKPGVSDEFWGGVVKNIDREVKNPVLKISGNKVTEFVPPVDGRKSDTKETEAKILQQLTEISDKKTISTDLVVRETKPENFENNQYGIRELVSRGVSDFSGSAAGRIYNIKLATSRINGSLIAPGEVFSFNQHLGDVSSATGYQSAYVIQNGRTVLGDGGGVCQVSTTTFRAALNAGMEIVARSPHAYRVGYYEKLGFKPGLDAAIYYPNLDFKFKNNTSKHILISAYTSGSRLFFDFYGTNDGRKVTISEPVVTNVRPAPEPKYEEDPSLPRGVTKQVDFAAAGATSRFTQTVELNGEKIVEETFTSVFRPWQAVYLVGTKDN